MNDNFIMTTASMLEGYKIIKQCGIVFGEVVFKHGFWKSVGASISDTIDMFKFGSRELSGSNKLIHDAREAAYSKMIAEAKSKGANAIIAIDSDNTIGDEIMYISLYGTAVKVVSLEDLDKGEKLEQERIQKEKAKREKLEEELNEKRSQIEADIQQRKENGEVIETSDSSVEELFLDHMKKEETVIEIWKLWNIYELGTKYRNIDGYLAMRRDTEIQQGKLNNIEKIKEVVEQMLQKEMPQRDAE